MNLTIIISVGIIITLIFHFIGVYAGAKKIVWMALALIWIGTISIATSEIKKQAYDDIKEMKGKYQDTDKIIKASMPKISVYEMILIKNSFLNHQHSK